jgi:hypothetical protein
MASTSPTGAARETPVYEPRSPRKSARILPCVGLASAWAPSLLFPWLAWAVAVAIREARQAVRLATGRRSSDMSRCVFSSAPSSRPGRGPRDSVSCTVSPLSSRQWRKSRPRTLKDRNSGTARSRGCLRTVKPRTSRHCGHFFDAYSDSCPRGSAAVRRQSWRKSSA